MTVKAITEILEQKAPLQLAEDFDNVGLLVGSPDMEVTGILVTLDTLEAVVEEAITRNCNLIVSFHPIVFKGLKRITGANYVERVVTRAIENHIAIYSMHTALDNVPDGVSGKMCEVLGLQSLEVLIPGTRAIKKLLTYVPRAAQDALLEKLFEAGAGHLGNYSQCSFSSEGMGGFLPESGANPTRGTLGQRHLEPEAQIHITFEAHREKSVLKALFTHHPYEEVAYEVTTLDNTYHGIGMGMIGHLPEPLEPKAFLESIKKAFHTGCIRHSALLQTPVQKVAVLGGSGAFGIDAALARGADFFITGDVKYHEFFKAEGKMVIADIGHYETEQFTKNLLAEYLSEKIPNFAISLSETQTNPINYF
ncbi:MAG: Nif3-like dinuclear metal center hexameric protein [Robiginitalea sp.]|uniref:Nif3-like dinuclear metal center hexameric protein n=2 Tax=Robiginitalea sp. TaxID=1902411 RepID=UPI003C76FFAF